MALRQALKDLMIGCLSLAISIFLGMVAYHPFSLNAQVAAAEDKEDIEPVTPDAILAPQFTTNDKSFESNGNMLVAVSMVNEAEAHATLNGAQKILASQLTLKPYSYLGKLVTISGEIYKIEQLPPDPGLDGDWYEILLIAKNINSPLGVTTIDCMYKGDASSLRPKSRMEFSGYFIGTGDSANSVGGQVEVIGLVGNAIYAPGHRQPSSVVPAQPTPPAESITSPKPSRAPQTSTSEIPAKPSSDKPAKIVKVQSRHRPHTKTTPPSTQMEVHRPTSNDIVRILQNKDKN